MKQYLNSIRQPAVVTTTQKVAYSVVILLVGIALGIVSKALDETSSNLLPVFLEMLDLRNFFSRMGVWLFCGLCISIFSSSPLRAALNSFLFFMGMVGSYYVYTIVFAGFYPKSYMMIWIAMTILSPFISAICWYARGTHIISLCISAVLLMFMARQAFAFGFWYFDIRYTLELFLWGATIGVLYRTPKQIIVVTGTGMLLFFLTSPSNLFFGML
jgi:hypothetical protein